MPSSRASARSAAYAGISNVASHPQFANLKIAQNCGEAAQVVLMRVRQRHYVEPLQPARPEKWRDHVFADVNARPPRTDIRAARQAAAIEQHRLTAGEGHKDRIALADVERW